MALTTLDPHDDWASSADDDLEIDAAIREAAPAQPPRKATPGSGITVRRQARVPPASTSAQPSEKSPWETVGQEGFTARMGQRANEMSASREGRRVRGDHIP